MLTTSIVRRLWPILLIVLAATGCERSANDYFPLEKGVTWVYRQKIVSQNKASAGAYGTSIRAAVAVNLASRTIGSEAVVPRLYGDGRVLYFQRTAEGVALVAAAQNESEAVTEIMPRYKIKFAPAIGETWSSNGETQVLLARFLGGLDNASDTNAGDGPFVYKVESLNDTVRVAAGTFRRCLRVHGTGSAKLAGGGLNGALNIAIETTEWYAPNVGLVKHQRKESTGPDGPVGADLTEELESIRHSGLFQ